MSATKRYRCLIRWTHRKWGPQSTRTAAEGSSIRRALNNALLAFFSDKSQRDRRRDAHVCLELKCERVKTPTALR